MEVDVAYDMTGGYGSEGFEWHFEDVSVGERSEGCAV